MPFRKKKKIGKSENMPWNILEDDTSCQAAERNPERGFEAITLQSTESHLPGTEETPLPDKRLSNSPSFTYPNLRPQPPDLQNKMKIISAIYSKLFLSLIFCLESA